MALSNRRTSSASMICAKFLRFVSSCWTLGMSWYTMLDQACEKRIKLSFTSINFIHLQFNVQSGRFTTLYRVSSQIDVLKHVQAKGLESLFRSSSRSLKICKNSSRGQSQELMMAFLKFCIRTVPLNGC